jgi:hypothetical protein
MRPGAKAVNASKRRIRTTMTANVKSRRMAPTGRCGATATYHFTDDQVPFVTIAIAPHKLIEGGGIAKGGTTADLVTVISRPLKTKPSGAFFRDWMETTAWVGPVCSTSSLTDALARWK